MTTTTAVQIRPLESADLPAYHALMQRALEEQPRSFGLSPEEWIQISPDALLAQLDREPPLGVILVAETAEGLVGTVRCQVHRQVAKMAHKGHLSWLYVVPELRQQGIARQLMHQVSDWAKAQNLEWLNLTVTVGQTEVQKFYRALGFEIWGYETHGLRLGETYFDLEHLQLKLSRKPI